MLLTTLGTAANGNSHSITSLFVLEVGKAGTPAVTGRNVSPVRSREYFVSVPLHDLDLDAFPKLSQ